MHLSGWHGALDYLLTQFIHALRFFLVLVPDVPLPSH